MSNPFAILSLIISIPFLGMLFVLTAKDDVETQGRNSSNVAIFTIISNLVLIWRIFMLIDERKLKLQLFEKFNWLSAPDINLVFAVDNLCPKHIGLQKISYGFYIVIFKYVNRTVCCC